MEPRLPYYVEISAELALLLTEGAVKAAREAIKTAQRSRRPKRGETLKPGLDTPLWNALSAAVQTKLTRYGEKAKLGRILGVPRQRVHEILRTRRQLPDAERTLLLLAWLHAKNSGRELA
jgi:hypothetical protein